MKPLVDIATDGAISYQPGPGGWSCVIESNGHSKEFMGTKEVATNQSLELEAVIQALWKLSRSCRVTVYTDSGYVADNINNGHLKQWQQNKWRNARGKKIKHQEMWETLLALMDMHIITFVWVRGHDGHKLNTRADELAVEASLLAQNTFPEALERAKQGLPPEAPTEEAVMTLRQGQRSKE